MAEETGAQSALSFQLFTYEDRLGALNMYSRTRDAFDDEDREEGLAIAAHIATAEHIEQMSSALDSRTAIVKLRDLAAELSSAATRRLRCRASAAGRAGVARQSGGKGMPVVAWQR